MNFEKFTTASQDANIYIYRNVKTANVQAVLDLQAIHMVERPYVFGNTVIVTDGIAEEILPFFLEDGSSYAVGLGLGVLFPSKETAFLAKSLLDHDVWQDANLLFVETCSFIEKVSALALYNVLEENNIDWDLLGRTEEMPLKELYPEKLPRIQIQDLSCKWVLGQNRTTWLHIGADPEDLLAKSKFFMLNSPAAKYAWLSQQDWNESWTVIGLEIEHNQVISPAAMWEKFVQRHEQELCSRDELQVICNILA